MTSSTLRRTGLATAGFLLGLVAVGLFGWIYFRSAQVEQIRETVGREVGLPPGLLDLVELDAEDRVRITLRDVVLLDAAGDTLASAPLLSAWLDTPSLSADGPIVFSEALLVDPFVRLEQTPGGEWTIFDVVRVEAEGEELALGDEEEEVRPVVFRDVTIRNGNVLLELPTEVAPPPDTARFALQLPTTRRGDVWYRVLRFRDVDARLPLLRVLGPPEAPWRVRVAALDARLAEPDLRITDLQGTFAAIGEQGVRLDVQTLAFGDSRLAGAGTIRFTEPEPTYDVQLSTVSLAFQDLQALVPGLPEEGRVQTQLAIRTTDDGRLALDADELLLSVADSRLAGGVTALLGGEGAPELRDADLDVDLELALLERLGLVDSLPVAGTVTGRIATRDADPALDVNLQARLVPAGQPDAEPSLVTLMGGLLPPAGEQPLRLRDLQIGFGPLRLSTLARALPEQQERLRGELRGAVTVSGTPTDLQIEAGELAYQVGDAQPTRLAGLAGTVTTEPELRFDLRARAEPLALGTLTELFPALPFRTAALAGPLSVSGTAEQLRFQADLAGDAGGIQLGGLVEPAAADAPLRFDVEGSLEAFTASRVIARELPVEGAVTGTFAAEGTTEDFAFNVDLAQTAGRFALQGRFRQGAEGVAPQIEVGGEVQNFRLGALIGRPGLFPDPLSGQVDVQGGGAEPYRFDVDLRGEDALFDLQGLIDTGETPRYDVSGRVAGLDLRRLPLPIPLPRTRLDATLDVDLAGGTLETLSGTLQVDASGSRVGGVPLREARVDAAFRDGVLALDTLYAELRDTWLAAEGMLGLTRPAPEPLRFALNAPNLTTLAQLATPPGVLQPQVAGALQLRGAVSGVLDDPAIALDVRGRRLRYEQWRAGTLALDLEAVHSDPVGWGGTLELAAEDLVLATGETLQSLRLEVDGSEEALAVGLAARRDAATDLALRTVVDFIGREPRGLQLEQLALRAEGVRWTLADSAVVRWGDPDEGVIIQNLLLHRTGGEPGRIAVEGRLPPTGEAAFNIEARGVDLADLRRVLGSGPDVGGVLALDATLQGAMTDPELLLQARVDEFHFEDVALDSLALRARYDEQVLATAAGLWTAGTPLALLELDVPLALSLEGLVPSWELLREAPLAGTLRADSVPLDLVATLLPPLQDGTGVLRAAAEIGGTLDQPRLDGRVRVRNGALGVVPLGQRFERITAALRLSGNRIVIDTLNARSDGYAALGGTITFVPGEGPRLDLETVLDGFQVIDREDVATVEASGRLALNGQLPAPTLTGLLIIDEATIAIPELDQQTGIEITDAEIGQIGADTLTAGGPLPAFMSGLQVSGLEIRLDEGVWLANQDARIQIGGELQVYRRGGELQLFGTLNATRGTYALEIGPITRQFQVVRGRVQFLGSPDLNPALDILAASKVRTAGGASGPELTVLVNITGTLEFPRIRFLSETRTPLPESELISYLVFGRPTFEVGGATEGLAERLIFQETLGGLFATGLEEQFLEFGLCDYVRAQTQVGSLLGAGLGGLGASLGSTLTSTGFECGKQLVPDVFLTAEWSFGFFAGVENFYALGLDWEIDPEWSVELNYGPVRRDPLLRVLNPEVVYQLSADVRRRWTYGDPSQPFDLDLDDAVDQEQPLGEVRIPSLAERQMGQRKQ